MSTARMPYTSRRAALIFMLAALWLAGPAAATEYLEQEDQEPHAPTVVRDLFVLPEGRDLDPRIAEADLAFSRDMRRHHQGAVDMARLDLDDPRGNNAVIQRLAQSIIHNQRFEIAVLELCATGLRRGRGRW